MIPSFAQGKLGETRGRKAKGASDRHKDLSNHASQLPEENGMRRKDHVMKNSKGFIPL